MNSANSAESAQKWATNRARKEALGYTRYTTRDRLWTLAALGRWLNRRRLCVIDLRPDIVAAFLRPRTQRARVHRVAAVTQRLFLEYLEQEGTSLVNREDRYFCSPDSILPPSQRRYWSARAARSQR